MRWSLLPICVAMAMACAGEQKKTETPATEAPPPSAGKKLDCTFARDLENCWRTVTAKLTACLGGKPTAPGKLKKDDASLCLLPEGAAVKLAEPCDPNGKCEVRKIFLGKGDKKCAEIESTIERPASDEGRGAGSLSVAIAEGTVRLDYDEKSKKVTCPDGSVYEGTGDWKGELADCADETGYSGVPAYTVTVSPAVKDAKKKAPAKVTVELASDVLFECEKP